jgi:hypothetical protein
MAKHMVLTYLYNKGSRNSIDSWVFLAFLLVSERRTLEDGVAFSWSKKAAMMI